jgi:hypothetical protein
VFARSGNIWRWQGGDASMIIEDGAASDPRWSPDGSQVSSSARATAFLICISAPSSITATFRSPSTKQSVFRLEAPSTPQTASG